MANGREERKRKKDNERVLNSPDIQKLRERIDDNTKSTTNVVYGADQSFIDRNKEDFNKIKGTIKSVSEKYKTITGDSTIEFLTKMALEEDKDAKGKKNNSKEADFNRNKINLNQILENPNNGVVNQLFIQDKGRFKLYDDYQSLHEFIPQLAQAIDVFVDNIMSPDDFTKDVFSVFYNGENVASNTQDEAKVIKNIHSLEEKYKIEDKARDWIQKSLIYGEQFIGVLPLEDEFNKILGEDGKLLNEHTDTYQFNESTVLLTEDEEKQLDELFNAEYADVSEEERKSKTVNWKNDLMNLLNQNVTYSENKYSLIKDEIIMENDFSSLNVRENFKNVNMSDININSNLGKKLSKAQEKKIKTGNDIVKDGGMFFNDVNEKDNNVKIKGSFVKLLDPRRTVKIKMGETCFGYYHVESNYNDKMGFTNSVLGGTANFTLRHTTDMVADSEYISDPKVRLIVDVFARNISKKLNKKFIENNQDFKKVIYELVKQDYIIRKRVNIVYLSPDDVEHFCIDEKEDGYGTSKYKKILFTAKLYLSVLTTTLMMKISRSADHRTFYIETGLSKDVEGIIQGFVREIKSKEVKLSDLKSIDTIFNSIGQFHDYFIPQTNGEKAIDIDTTPGQQTEIENEFLEYLKKTMISGMGIPASFLQYSDEMEFARSVSMTNGMFLRTIVGLQKTLGENFSNLYRKLYKNEYGIDASNSDDDEFIPDYNRIEVKFPPPATLNMTNLTDQISNTQGIVDFIVTSVAGSAASDEIRDKITREANKKYLPNIDWEFFEGLLSETSIEEVEDKLKKTGEEDTESV